MSDPVITSGAEGGAQYRFEIRDFIKIEDQFSLYIQALAAMQADDQNNLISHFSISGIHGQPYESWNNTPDDPEPVQKTGYCTHGSVLFPTWHRPYVVQYEQVLQQHAIEIAETYEVDKERWQLAARNLRAPYWDWVEKIVPPDEVISKDNVDILIPPNGTSSSVKNPLLQYTFRDNVQECFVEPWNQYDHTFRDFGVVDPEKPANVENLRRELALRQSEIVEDIYNLLTRIHTWPAFSNHTTPDDLVPQTRRNTNSLEAIHDRIHVYVGGHMGETAVAAFDPIFYLHHANVDRLLALWSAIHSNIWVTPGSSVDGTITIPPGSEISENTPLTPFRDRPLGFWASAAIVETSKFGYKYEFAPDSGQDKLARYINEHYGGPLLGLFAAQATGPGTETTTINDWMARIRFKKFELRHSFAVLIFLGDVPEDVREWRTSPNFVGTHVAFVNSAADQCANCLNQVDAKTEGFVHLNSTIAKRLSSPGPGSFEPDVIVNYLQKNLHWRVQSYDRSEIDTARLTSLEVTVAAARLRQEPGAIFPIDEDPIFYHDITRGVLGGVVRSDPA